MVEPGVNNAPRGMSTPSTENMQRGRGNPDMPEYWGTPKSYNTKPSERAGMRATPGTHVYDAVPNRPAPRPAGYGYPSQFHKYGPLYEPPQGAANPYAAVAPEAQGAEGGEEAEYRRGPTQQQHLKADNYAMAMQLREYEATMTGTQFAVPVWRTDPDPRAIRQVQPLTDPQQILTHPTPPPAGMTQRITHMGRRMRIGRRGFGQRGTPHCHSEGTFHLGSKSSPPQWA